MWSQQKIANPLHCRSQQKPGGAVVRVALLLLLCLATILFFQFFPRYTVLGPELLADPTFQDKLQAWSPGGPGVSVPAPGLGMALLRNDDPGRSISFSQEIKVALAYPLLRLACDVKTVEVIQDPQKHNETWHAARILLIPYDTAGKPRYALPHTLAQLLGTNDWQHHEGIFMVHPGTTHLTVMAQLLQVRGTLWVKDLSLRPVVEKAAFGRCRKAAILLWLAAALWTITPLLRSVRGQGQRLAILALGLLIMVAVLMPEALKEHLGNALWPALAKTIVPNPDPVTFRFLPLLPALGMSKAGHFVLFALLAAVALFRRPYPVARPAMAGFLLLFALATEVAQLMVAGRSAQLADILIDGLGMLTGFVLMRLVTWQRLRPRLCG